MLNLILFGKPGSGKGTQASFLKNKYGLVHISTGDDFRKNIKTETELGLKAKLFAERGELVPDQITVSMLENEIKQNLPCLGFIFDGFPRTVNQAIALDNMLNEKNLSIDNLISLEVDDDELISRIKKRALVSGRVDDQSEEKINNRIKVDNEETLPVLNHYKKLNKYIPINGVGSIDEIFELIISKIDE